MPARLSAFVMWAAAAAAVVFWVLRLGVTPLAAPPGPTLALAAATPRADLSRLLGSAPVSAAVVPAPVAESTRFRLLGVIAEGAPATGGAPARGGVALLAIDGKLPRALRVGAPIDGGLMLQSVTRRGVAIGAPGAPASVLLELPPLPAPATGEPLRLRTDGSVIGAPTTTMAMPNAPTPAMPGTLPPGLPAMPPPPPPVDSSLVQPLPPGMPPTLTR